MYVCTFRDVIYNGISQILERQDVCRSEVYARVCAKACFEGFKAENYEIGVLRYVNTPVVAFYDEKNGRVCVSLIPCEAYLGVGFLNAEAWRRVIRGVNARGLEGLLREIDGKFDLAIIGPLTEGIIMYSERAYSEADAEVIRAIYVKAKGEEGGFSKIIEGYRGFKAVEFTLRYYVVDNPLIDRPAPQIGSFDEYCKRVLKGKTLYLRDGLACIVEF